MLQIYEINKITPVVHFYKVDQNFIYVRYPNLNFLDVQTPTVQETTGSGRMAYLLDDATELVT